MGALVTTTSPALAHESHEIEPGDSLWEIAAAHGLSVAELAEANGISNPDLIRIGSTLVIPGVGSTNRTSTAAPRTASAGVYVVQAGDTLWDIADANGIGVGMLARQNSLEGSDPTIFPGQELVITPGATPSASPTAAPTATSGTDVAGLRVVDAHTVSSGETLWEIANRYGVSTESLARQNGLDGASIIRPGDSLRIPGLVSSNLPADLQGDPERLELLAVFDRWADEYDVPADLLKALAWFESGWNNEKISSANAIGIGQILPITARFVSDSLVGQDLDPTVADQNIRLAARYLRYLLDATGDTRLAVASYYQGLTATRTHGIYSSSEFYVDGILALRWRFE